MEKEGRVKGAAIALKEVFGSLPPLLFFFLFASSFGGGKCLCDVFALMRSALITIHHPLGP